MKKRILLIVLSLLCLGITACDAGENSRTQASGYTNIKPEEAKKRLDSENGIILLDVRTQEEYAQKHIPNSILIPVDVIEEEAKSKITDKNSTIFVYCRSGSRSTAASEALVKMGYTKVYNLGGINDWPFETVSGK